MQQNDPSSVTILGESCQATNGSNAADPKQSVSQTYTLYQV